jgi:hypothetical protein
MRNLLLFMLLVGIFVLGRNSCHHDGFNFNFGPGERGQGPSVSETRTPGNFNKISSMLSADIVWESGQVFEVQMNGQANILALLRTEIDGNTLKLYFDGNISTHEPIQIKVISPSISGVEMNGSGNFTALSKINGEQVSLEINGSGNISVPDVSAIKLTTQIVGSGDLSLGGQSNQLQIEILGSGNFKGKSLSANEVSATIAGSGDIYCQAVTTLKAEIMGSGNVYYSGSASVQSDIAGSGEVIKAP